MHISTLTKLILPCLFTGMLLVSSATAFGSLSVLYTDSLGRSWTDPFSADLLNQNYTNQLNAFTTDGYTFATIAEIEQSAFADGYSNDSVGVTQWLTAKFFGGINPSLLGSPCSSTLGCDIRTNTPLGLEHTGLFSGGLSYAYVSISDSSTGDINYGLGALGYKILPTPEPSMIGLLGTGFLLIGYAAYRRHQK